MCNGTGRVVRSTERSIEHELGIYNNDFFEIQRGGTFNLRGISRKVISTVNKNEYELYTRNIIKYLRIGDAMKVALTFNNLIYLTEIDQPYIKRLRQGLLQIKTNSLNDLVLQNTIEGILKEDYEESVDSVKNQFELLGKSIFGQ